MSSSSNSHHPEQSSFKLPTPESLANAPALDPASHARMAAAVGSAPGSGLGADLIEHELAPGIFLVGSRDKLMKNAANPPAAAAPARPPVNTVSANNVELMRLELQQALLSLKCLRHTQRELQPFADAGDADAAEAITENDPIIDKTVAQIASLRREIGKLGGNCDALPGLEEFDQEERIRQGLAAGGELL
ncbi:hypothetical protein H696_00403 [Fonticula alba]|uniref:Uncharacterized protein n=1 Tax=Fonticula alba TaxID=691883 RepID=A0A058ZH67_FONAL|nr:hypothetical protein H696_00403 [Fonticula alba]KCV72827.1 hypothetical protein H696_00403 [Fonticula alba]|eukprot:XP_009492528.1 hypothetical protein H696_00403 [Fonticula alba]